MTRPKLILVPETAVILTPIPAANCGTCKWFVQMHEWSGKECTVLRYNGAHPYASEFFCPPDDFVCRYWEAAE